MLVFSKKYEMYIHKLNLIVFTCKWFGPNAYKYFNGFTSFNIFVSFNPYNTRGTMDLYIDKLFLLRK